MRRRSQFVQARRPARGHAEGMTSNDRSPSLLAWQWALYEAGHRSRANLAVHALTVPLFWLGTLVTFGAPFVAPIWTPLGLVAMVGAIAAQGRTHAGEAVAPVPFAGPRDVVARIVCEQWVTFPRYVVSGGFARAWRGETQHKDPTRRTRTSDASRTAEPASR